MPKNEYYFPQRSLVSQQDQSLVARSDVPRTKFSGAWNRLTTFDAGFLVPFLVDEILPGDHMTYSVTAYLRMATPLFPIFSAQRVDTHFFFVPNRLVWSDWKRFMGEQADPTESIDIQVPIITGLPAGPVGVGTIFDHMGLPAGGQMAAGVVTAVVLPFRGYNLIYNEWFRDQNLQAKLVTNGTAAGDFALRRRAKSHDYFTSALPWPQKFTAPTVPISGSAPIRGIGLDGAVYGGGVNPSPPVNESDGGTRAFPFSGLVTEPNAWYFETMDPAIAFTPQIFADLSQATGVNINQLRQAMLVQQLLEKDAHGGTRYTEINLKHFGVRSPDMRLQRPEYIGGGSTPLEVTPIAQTAEGTLPVGSLGAASTAVGQHRASYASTEHGFIIGLISIKTELSYQQGLHRMFSRRTRFDYYWPSLAQLGEQAVLRKELWVQGVATDELVFGYQERWQEYRQRYSDVTGVFNSGVALNIDEWHLAQLLTAPVLGAAFIADDPPMERVLAAGALAVNQQYLADINIQRTAVRPLPMFGTPAILGRF